MNSQWKLPRDQLAALRFEDLQLYLASRGWEVEQNNVTSQAVAYHFPNEPDAEIILPRQRNIADYAFRMADVVEMLAAVEDRSYWAVINDISIPPADVVRLQIAAPDTTLGMVPLNAGIDVINGGRGMLLAAACSVNHPQAYYPRQSFKEAKEFLESCRLGQTERGSFIATILTPVPPAIRRQQKMFVEDEVAEENEPFARRVTLRLMSGLDHISNAIEFGEHERILDGVAHGVSANLCDAVSEMQPHGDQTRLQISMSWSRNRPIVPRSVRQNVSFSQTAFSIIKEAGRSLRETAEPKRHHIEGHVVALRAETTLFEGFEGIVSIKALVDGTACRVQITLNRDDYQTACNAHRDGKTVSVEGLLVREAKSFRLDHPEQFRVAQNNSG